MNWPRGSQAALPVGTGRRDPSMPTKADRPDEVAVRDGVADLLDPPQVFGQLRLVALGMKTISAPSAERPASGSAGRSRCRPRPCRPRLNTG
jgi:hypothetical protein